VNLTFKKLHRAQSGSMALAFFLILATAGLSILIVSILAWQVGQVKTEKELRDSQWALESTLNIAAETVGSSGRALIDVPMSEPAQWVDSEFEGIATKWWAVPLNSRDIATFPVPETFAYMVANDNLAIAISFTNLVYISSDGVSWVQVARSPLPYSEISDITFGRGNFIISARPNATKADSLLYYSSNGKDWNGAAIFKPGGASSETISRVACSPNSCALITTNKGVSTRYWNSANLADWNLVADTLVETNIAISSEIAYGANRFVAIGFDGMQSSVSFSTDGATWSSSNTVLTSGEEISDLEVVNNSFIGINAGTNDTLLYEDREATFGGVSATQNLLISTDGLIWNSVSLPSSQYWGDIISDGKTAFLLAESDNTGTLVGSSTFLTSNDGTLWETRTMPRSGAFRNGIVMRNVGIMTSPYSTEGFIASKNAGEGALPNEIYVRAQVQTAASAAIDGSVLENSYKFSWNVSKNRWELSGFYNKLDFSLNAKYSGAPQSGAVPLVDGLAIIEFTDTSTGSPTSWYWDFGDGTTATEQNPTKTYTAAGRYNVRLTVYEPSGYSSTYGLLLLIQSPPTPPQDVTSEAVGTSSLQVSWRAPLNDGANQITNYQIRYRPTGAQTWLETNVGPNAMSETLTGLEERTDYEIQVAAVTALGLGEWSTSLNGSPLQVPTQPTDFSLTGLVDMVATWVEPEESGGAPITRYRVQTSTNIDFTENVRFVDLLVNGGKITHLDEYTTYFARIFAINSAGISSASNIVTVSTLGRPGAPTSVDAEAVDNTILVTWNAPAETGGSNVAGYIVEYTTVLNDYDAGTRVSLGASSTEYSFVPTPGVLYYIKVRAVSLAGLGAYSPEQQAIGNLPPQAIPGLSAIGQEGAVLLSWNSPTQQSSGGAAITSYTITWSSSNNILNSVTISGTSNSILIDLEDKTGDGIPDDALVAGRNYVFSVTAINPVGSLTVSTSGTPTN
jgi:PKD repeat protein